MHATRTCSIDGCSDPHRSRGFCNKHYQAALKRGLAPKVRLSAEERFWSKVDKTPTCWRWLGTTIPKGYGVFTVGRKKIVAHRFSYELAYGPIGAGLQVDHICRVRNCVRPDHLREVTGKQNLENLSPFSKHGRSGIRGVQWDSQFGKWRTVVTHHGRYYYGGRYASVDEAAEAVRALRNRLQTHNDLDRVEGGLRP